MSTLVLRDELFLEHDPGPGHPENPGRLAAILADLSARPVEGTRTASPRDATAGELERVHGAAYVARVADTRHHAATRLDADTSTCARSYEAAVRAAGAVLQGVEEAVAGDARGAFALVRPPGHHAEAHDSMGFCLFNNVALAAAHAVDALGCRRVLVLDPDVHHGNGTQHAFEDRDDVLYVSSHRFPFFPGTGALDEIGRGSGEGFTINLPLPPGQGDDEILHLYRRVVDPVVRSWEPDLILVSAGFDSLRGDPLGGMTMTPGGFASLFALFRTWSDACCPGRLVAALEGGYDPAGLTAGVRAALESMGGGGRPAAGARVRPAAGTAPHTSGAAGGAPPDIDPAPAAVMVAERVRRILTPHWPALA